MHRGLSLQRIQFIDIDVLLRLEDLHEQGQTHSHFGGGHRDDEEREDLPAETLIHAGKCDEGEVGRIQHQLNRHENNKRVAPDQHTQRANGNDLTGASSSTPSNMITNRNNTMIAPAYTVIWDIAMKGAPSNR